MAPGVDLDSRSDAAAAAHERAGVRLVVAPGVELNSRVAKDVSLEGAPSPAGLNSRADNAVAAHEGFGVTSTATPLAVSGPGTGADSTAAVLLAFFFGVETAGLLRYSINSAWYEPESYAPIK